MNEKSALEEKANEAVSTRSVSMFNLGSRQMIGEEIEKSYKSARFEHFGFKLSIFFKFFLLSLLYVVIGPLMLFVVCWKKNWFRLACNLHLLGRSTIAMTRYIQWVFRWFAIIITALQSSTGKYSNLYVNLYLLVITEISLAVLYAAYYSSFRKSEIDRFMEEKGYKIGRGTLSNQIMRLNRASNENIFSPKRLNMDFPDVDFSMFYFAVPAGESHRFLPCQTIEATKLRKEDFKEVHDCGFISGIDLAKSILNKVERKGGVNERGLLCGKIISRVIVLVRILYPIGSQIIGIYLEISNTPGAGWKDYINPKNLLIVLAYVCYFLLLYGFYVIYDVLFLGILIYVKKLSIMDRLGKLISRGRNFKDDMRISLLIPQNNTNWINLRRILASCDAQIHTIVDVNLFFVICFVIFMIAFLLANAIGHVPYPVFLQNNAFQVVTATYLIIMIIIVVLDMVIGIIINGYFHSHKVLLHSKLDFVKELLEFPSYYFKLLNEIEEKCSENPKDQFFQQLFELKKISTCGSSQEIFVSYLSKTAEVLEHSIKRLEWEALERPTTIFGIATTPKVLIAFSSIFTILGASNIRLIIYYAQGRHNATETAS